MAPSRPQNPSHLSFFEVLRQHSTKLLYREPLKWTQEHLDIFQCSFSMNENKSDTVDNSGLSLSEMSADALYRQTQARRLAVSRCWYNRGCAMADLMKPYTGERPEGSVYFKFHRDNDAIHNYRKRFRICNSSILVEGPVSIADINLRNAEKDRKRLVEWRPRSDDVMLNVGKRRYARVKPANYLHDPLIAAIAIGLAQRQRYGSGTQSPTCDCQVHHVRILAYKDRQHLYVYTTSISSAFLELLKFPSKRPRCSKSSCRKIHFQITPISYKPYHSLHVRISSVLGLKELEDNKVQCTQGVEKGQAKELGKEDGSRAVKQQQPSQSSDAPATKQPLQSCDAPATKQPLQSRNAPATKRQQSLQSNNTLATKQPLQSSDAPATKRPWYLRNAPAAKKTVLPLSINMNAANRMLRYATDDGGRGPADTM
ncbi:hypothetical protein F4860DRAFT_428219 [Xylaria cubensis]|nr:hypothetical protein F4860DRAFT_428219 [Xylaria cubensis]